MTDNTQHNPNTPPELPKHCPFYQMTCEDARAELHSQNLECEFCGVFTQVTTKLVLGVPKQETTKTEVCKFEAMLSQTNELIGMVTGLQNALFSLLAPKPRKLIGGN